MRNRNPVLSASFAERLDDFLDEPFPIVGLTTDQRKATLVAQLVDSQRRLDYLALKSQRANSADLFTPYSGSFEPFGGAASHLKAGRLDDAYWLVYLATHFGKHKYDAWNLTEDIYGRFGGVGVWDWDAVSADPAAIEHWLADLYPETTNEGRSRRFGNHRKFETLKPGPKGTGNALRTYIEWVMGYGSHHGLLTAIHVRVGQNPTEVFAELYRELDQVAKLGRLGKFDLLCNLSNLMIAPILPDRAYIPGSTGPVNGAKLLFGNGYSHRQLDNACAALAGHLQVSPQVIEDALCNWQKSPHTYRYFRG